MNGVIYVILEIIKYKMNSNLNNQKPQPRFIKKKAKNDFLSQSQEGIQLQLNLNHSIEDENSQGSGSGKKQGKLNENLEEEERLIN